MAGSVVIWQGAWLYGAMILMATSSAVARTPIGPKNTKYYGHYVALAHALNLDHNMANSDKNVDHLTHIVLRWSTI